MSSEINVFSDFDNTIIGRNAAVFLLQNYLWHNSSGEPWYLRAWNIRRLLKGSSRRKHFADYYACLRKIPAKARRRLLESIPISENWKRAVLKIKRDHHVDSIGLVIVSRNTVDVISPWLESYEGDLRQLGVKVRGIVANSPLDEDAISTVKKDGARHMTHVAFGQLMSDEKDAFVGKNSVYIGDREEIYLIPHVRKFVRV